MTAPAPLGAGDHDGIDRGTAKAVRAPLGPGDSETDAPPVELPAPPPAPGPGDGDDDEWIVRPPAPLGPGDLQVPQASSRVRRK